MKLASSIVPSLLLAGCAFSAAAAADIVPEQQQHRKLAKGHLKNLVIPVRFADHTDRELPSSADFEQIWNGPCEDGNDICPLGSVKEYFFEASHGLLTIESTVTEWVTISQTEAYCAINNWPE
jgi:hypothetical protein